MLGRFLDYVEIKTKITSVFAFVMALVFLIGKGEKLNVRNNLIFFFAMLIFDMTTTAINNYIDSKTGSTALQFKRQTALFIIWIMFIYSVILGLYLATQTGPLVYVLGIFCFLAGIMYTYGPIPISRLPLGEIFSGLFYGVFIPFLVVYINSPLKDYIDFRVEGAFLGIQINIINILILLLLVVTPTAATAGIMLANNICDMEADIKVNRFTLPYYLGKVKSLYLFVLLYVIIYGSAILLVSLKIFGWVYLLPFFLISPLLLKQIKLFLRKQVKNETFIVSVKNYVLMMSAQIIGLILNAFH